MKTPSPENMRDAATWLDHYEGANDDHVDPSCKEVAQWLRDQARKADERNAAKKHNLTVKRIRELIRELEKEKDNGRT